MDLNDFLGFLNQMSAVIKEKDKQYGDSWKVCDIDFLRKRLEGEIHEWRLAIDKWNESSELIDIGICCLLLWNRLEEGSE